jgi:threonine dehydratase
MPSTDARRLPVFADILAARERLAPRAVRTPLLESPALNELAGGRVLVKAEALQLTGSFKFRGAFNLVSKLSEDERRRGVVAFSSGNHAQGVAAAAKLAGAPAVIVMPDDAPSVKLEGTRRWGAEIVTYDRREHDAREGIAERILAKRGGALVRPFDDADIMAGQGTAGLELIEQAEAIGARLDAVIAPCSGGGLASGIAIAVKELTPATEVYTVEPEGFDDMARSLQAGERRRNAEGAATICDALQAPQPGVLTFAVASRALAGGLVASDADAFGAMRAAFLHLKLVLEPAGALSLAAVLSRRYDARGKTVCVVASGGNVDPETFRRALAA